MRFENIYFINGLAYAGKSTMVRLLAERFHGLACEENYQDRLLPELDKEEFPCLTYTRDLEDFRLFIRRSPDEYARWIQGVTKECETLELRILRDLKDENQLVFVDTNISVDTLKKVASPGHVLIMLADPDISVHRFFDRPDAEKQFLYQLLLREADPGAAMDNFRRCLEKINSRENYDAFLHSGFPVIFRDENRSVEETFSLVKKAFGLDHE